MIDYVEAHLKEIKRKRVGWWCPKCKGLFKLKVHGTFCECFWHNRKIAHTHECRKQWLPVFVEIVKKDRK